jgi:tetratricopeptide (TPR) repeat protein
MASEFPSASLHPRWALVAAGMATVMALATPAFAQNENIACGSLENAFGPFDYRTERGDSLRLVESAHFTVVVENLLRGQNSGRSPAGDLDYTLRAYPNHHRALLSVMRYGEKNNSMQPRDLRYSVECYFDRALRFRPDDSVARMIFATFLSRNKRTPEALEQLERAKSTAKDNPFTHYNIGLIYLDMKQYDKALAEAHKAYGLGFTQPALKEGLVAAGKWTEPPAPAAEGAKPAAPATQ